jgi:hypothetical protein
MFGSDADIPKDGQVGAILQHVHAGGVASHGGGADGVSESAGEGKKQAPVGEIELSGPGKRRLSAGVCAAGVRAAGIRAAGVIVFDEGLRHGALHQAQAAQAAVDGLDVEDALDAKGDRHAGIVGQALRADRHDAHLPEIALSGRHRKSSG